MIPSCHYSNQNGRRPSDWERVLARHWRANIFRAVFDRKRLQPGKLNGRKDVDSFGHTVSAIGHDCSTLGGNSGSALVAVDDLRVVGLHFCGVTHESNYAVPTWELLSDPAFAGQQLNFV